MLLSVLSVTSVELLTPPREALGSLFEAPPLSLILISDATIGTYIHLNEIERKITKEVSKKIKIKYYDGDSGKSMPGK
jgi:hypothetical protein